MPRHDPDVAVIIPTYNQADELARTLRSLTHQRYPAERFEVVVADDGSSDRTGEVARAFASRVRLTYCYQPDEGFRAAAVRNLGARHTRAPALVFLDTGTLAGPDFVGAHRAHLTGRPNTAVIGYAFGYRPWDSGAQLGAALRRMTPAEAVERYRDEPWMRDWRHDLFDPERIDLATLSAPWLLFQGMNCAVRAADFWSVGGYDGDFRHWGVDDIELGFRLFRRGVRFVVGTDAWAMEVPGPRDMRFRLRDVKHNGWYFLNKHREPVAEILWRNLMDEEIWPVEPEYAGVRAWARRVRDRDVHDEIAGAVGRHGGGRVTVFGCGARIPAELHGCALVEFDRALLDRATATGGHTGHHGIGVRTPLADGSSDVVVVTSRLSGLWSRWGDHILAEARRVGGQVIAPTNAGIHPDPTPGRPSGPPAVPSGAGTGSV